MKATVKSVQRFIVVLLFFNFSITGIAQSFTEDLSRSTEQKNKSAFVTMQMEAKVQKNERDNQITIVQIGNLNSATLGTRADKIHTEVVQNGQDNFIFSYKDAKSINQFMEQKGNNNFILDFGRNKGVDVNQQFLQKGSNLNIISTGLNSISKDMTIQQTGSARTVSVISL